MNNPTQPDSPKPFDYLDPSPADQLAAQMSREWMFSLHQLGFTLAINPALVHPSFRPMMLKMITMCQVSLTELLKGEKKDEQRPS